MTEDFDRESRKNKNKKNNISKSHYEISDEQKFISKSKKAFKNKINDIRGDELWEDWEEDWKK